MLQTVRVEKVDEKTGIICLVFMFPSCVMVLKLSKKVHFLQFCVDFRKKPKSVKAIYILHLKVLITIFQKMISFIVVSATIYEILAIKISKKMLTHQKFNKIIRLQTLISPKHRVMHNKQLSFPESA